MKLDIAEQPKFAAPANHRGEHHPFRDSHKLRRRLRGDLDTIVLHALRKEPHRRYGSVEQFAEDIRHHLEGLPVTVRRDSWRYRAGKFVVRHKLGVAAAALVIFAVLGGVAATVREARIAAANQRRNVLCRRIGVRNVCFCCPDACQENGIQRQELCVGLKERGSRNRRAQNRHGTTAFRFRTDLSTGRRFRQCGKGISAGHCHWTRSSGQSSRCSARLPRRGAVAPAVDNGGPG